MLALRIWLGITNDGHADSKGIENLDGSSIYAGDLVVIVILLFLGPPETKDFVFV